MLLQLRSYNMPVMPGHLATVGGMRDHGDADSRVTAMREVVEETGLLDLGLLEGAPAALRRQAVARDSTAPSALLKFAEGANVDWWVLLLSGPGVFDRARDLKECADIRMRLPKLPGAVLA